MFKRLTLQFRMIDYQALKCNETVPGFMKGGKQSAENLVNNMIQTLEDKGVSLSKSRSYKVDSTVNMVGIYPGIQAQLL